jgi:hypothetical protein
MYNEKGKPTCGFPLLAHMNEKGISPIATGEENYSIFSRDFLIFLLKLIPERGCAKANSNSHYRYRRP